MISTNQKRKFIRVGTNLVGKISLNNKSEKIVFVRDVSAIGAKIECKENPLSIGEVMSIKFKFKDALYNVLCKVVRKEDNSNFYGVQFYFKGDSETYKLNTNYNLNNNKIKLYQDILDEYFQDRELYV